MICRYCGKENGADAKFCQGCGKELTYPADILQKENGQPANKEITSEPEYDAEGNRQKKIFIRICTVLIICVVGGFVLDKFGIFRFLPKEINDCLGMEMELFQNKYHMGMYDEDSIIANNVLIRANDNGKIISVYSDCKGVFRVYGITCGMSEEQVIEKVPSDYTHHSSENGSDYYLSYDTDRVLAFDFDADKVLKSFSYFYYNASFSAGIEKLQRQSKVNKSIPSKLPREVSGFLEKETAEVKKQYQLETDEIFDMALEKDNVSMLDSDEDGRIDGITISDKPGQYTLFGMNCGTYFSESYVSSKYYLFNSTDTAYENGRPYFMNEYACNAEHRILRIKYWEDKKIKEIVLAYSKEEAASATPTLPEDVSVLLGKNVQTVKKEYQLNESNVLDLEKDNVYMSDADDDGKIDMVNVTAHGGNHTLFGMACNNYFNEDSIPSGYKFYDSSEASAMMNMDGYTRCRYLSQDKQKLLLVEYWGDERIKDILLILTKGEIESENYSSSYENQEDDAVYDTYAKEDEDDMVYGMYSEDEEEEDDYFEYILPYSDVRKLKKSDLQGLSKKELRLARNEIYARHGRRFQDSSLQEYFDAQDWYMGYIEPEDFVDSEQLSALERRNAKFIQKFE